MVGRSVLKHKDGTPYTGEERRLHRNELVRVRYKLGPVVGRAPKIDLTGFSPEEKRQHHNRLQRARYRNGYAPRNLEHSKAWRKKNPEKIYNLKRRATFKWMCGITVEEFEAKVLVQGGRCGICGTDTPGGRGTWKIDPCHTTKKIRQLLCHRCNIGIGMFKDDPDVLRRAARYLD